MKKTFFANTIFLFTARANAHWRVILTCCLKNWMQKDKGKLFFDCLSWKSQAHSLMKQSISRLGMLCISMTIGIKWCPSWNLLYLWILTMVLSFAVALTNRLMTLVLIVSHVRLITITSTIKTWSLWVM
jgi:hypothetical protein